MSDCGKKEKGEKCEKREKIEVEKIAKNTATKRERAAVENIAKQNVLKKDNLENAQKFKKRKLSPIKKPSCKMRRSVTNWCPKLILII